MIEFTMARVCMSICGLVLLAAIIAPVTGMYESKAVNMESEISDNIASLVDEFYYSKMETFTVSVSDLLPDIRSYIELKGHLVIFTTERGVYKSGTNVPMVTDGDGLFRHGDILRMSKNDGKVIIERLA